MAADEMTDEELVDNLEFCAAVMDTDSAIDDVWLEYEDGEKIYYRDLLNEAAKRSEGRT